MKSLFAYAEGEKKKMTASVILSVLSVCAGLVPFYCMYKVIGLFAADTATTDSVIMWSMIALAAYAVKIATFTLSTGISHNMAYNVLAGLAVGWRIVFCALRSETYRIIRSEKSRG